MGIKIKHYPELVHSIGDATLVVDSQVILTAGEDITEPDIMITINYAVDEEGNDIRESLAKSIGDTLKNRWGNNVVQEKAEGTTDS